MELIVFALVPVAIVIFYIYLKDKYEKEPKRLLLISFLLGAIVSIIITTLLYGVFDLALPLTDSLSVSQQFVHVIFLSKPLIIVAYIACISNLSTNKII
ncbi:hypothetical protein [Lacinutrix sp.]|mgnify:CR=1 FL=1|uniref:hypothetical protein n=1 Tax=Lacinutrix sp. TaxID=1937692 RepID=UPI002602E305|nr:hypothetical protein [Lacinutrix sp.]MDG1714881.1 hypothetical protein [Lacinutrix sp.]